MLGTLFASTQSIQRMKHWVFIGCSLIIAVNLSSLVWGAHAPAGIARLAAGIGSGLGFGYGLKMCAVSPRPTRSFGIFTGSMSLVMIIGFQLVAYLIESRAAVRGVVDPELVKTVAKVVFGTYAFLAAAGASIAWLYQPRDRSKDDLRSPEASGVPAPFVLISLLAIVLAFMGQGGIWAFLQIMGVAHGFSIGSVANAMSAFAIMGVVGSLTAAAAPQQMPRWAGTAAALGVLWCGLYALYAPASLMWYVAGCAIGGFYWNFTLPLMLGLLARIDATGRGAVLGGMMSSVGSAMGPLLAGLLVQHNNYQPVGWMTGTLCLVSLVCVWYVERRGVPASQVLAH